MRGRGMVLFQIFQLRQVANCIQRVYLFNGHTIKADGTFILRQSQLWGNPRCELKSNILMGKGGCISSLLRLHSNSSSPLYPSFRSKCKAIQPRLAFNCLEFEAIKLRIVKSFPKSNETNGVAIAHPVLNYITRILCGTIFGNVRQRKEIASNVQIADLYGMAISYDICFLHNHNN